MIKDILVKPTTIIISQMLTTGSFPDKLKIYKIMPIYKKDETLFTNYRPIFLLPTFSKLFEKVILKQSSTNMDMYKNWNTYFVCFQANPETCYL